MKNLMQMTIFFQMFLSSSLWAIIIPPVAPLMHNSVDTVTLQSKENVAKNTNTNVPKTAVNNTLQPLTPSAQGKVITPPAKDVSAKVPPVSKAAPKVVAPPAPKAPTPPAKVAPTVTPPAKVVAATPTVAPVATPQKKTITRTSQPESTQLVMRRILIENTSRYPAKLNGMTVHYSISDKQDEIKKLSFSNSHTLQPKTKQSGGVIARIKEITISAPIQATGTILKISALNINGQDVPVKYKGLMWYPGDPTDVIYITSANGSKWQLDKKAMDQDYAKLSGNTVQSDVENTQQISKTSQAVAVATMQKKNNKKLKKQSKSTKAVASIS